jgi:hypothetical protein
VLVHLQLNKENMKHYEIEVVETLSRVIPIEAINEEQAIEVVKDLYSAGTIVLDSNDHDNDTRFNVISNELNELLA